MYDSASFKALGKLVLVKHNSNTIESKAKVNLI